jgi:hypothetical protein
MSEWKKSEDELPSMNKLVIVMSKAIDCKFDMFFQPYISERVKHESGGWVWFSSSSTIEGEVVYWCDIPNYENITDD